MSFWPVSRWSTSRWSALSKFSLPRITTALALSTALISSTLAPSVARAQSDASDQAALLKNYALSLCMVKVYEKLEGKHEIADLLQQEVFAFLEEGTMGANTENKEIYKKVFVKTAEYAASVPPESALAGCLDWQGNMLKQG